MIPVSTIIANGIKQNHELLAPTNGDADAPTIVCVHGLLIDSLASYYFTMAKQLRDAGFRVLLYDLRAHGNSERPESGYTVETFVEDLAALLDALEITCPVYLIGNSFGGTIAYGYAERHPERVAGITAIESEPVTAEWAVKLADILNRAATQLGRFEALAWITARHGTHMTRRVKRAKKMLDATTLERDIPASRVLTHEEFAAISCPVLAVYGTESDLAVQAPLLERLIPRCTAVVLPDLDHSVLVEAPAVVLDLVLGWIAEHRLDGVGSGAGAAA
jgi:pimeloyl-ACP methyl ester carboxylesterase